MADRFGKQGTTQIPSHFEIGSERITCEMVEKIIVPVSRRRTAAAFEAFERSVLSGVHAE